MKAILCQSCLQSVLKVPFLQPQLKGEGAAEWMCECINILCLSLKFFFPRLLPPDLLSITCFLARPLHPLRSHQLTSWSRCHKSPPGSSSRPPATDILTISPPYMFKPSQCGFITRTSNMHQCTQTSLLKAKNQPTLTITFFRYYRTVAEPPFPLLLPECCGLILIFTCLICILGKTETLLCIQMFRQVDTKLLSVNMSRSLPLSTHDIIVPSRDAPILIPVWGIGTDTGVKYSTLLAKYVPNPQHR